MQEAPNKNTAGPNEKIYSDKTPVLLREIKIIIYVMICKLKQSL